MAFHVCRTDSRFFLWVVISFNIVLAFYNFVSFHIDSGNPRPCIVIVQANSSRTNWNALPAHLSATPGYLSEKHLPLTTQKQNELSTLPPNPLTSKSPNSVTISAGGKQMNWSTEVRNNFQVIHSYIPADLRPTFEGDVTLTTQGTFEFLNHVVQLCRRWDGPVSVAVYAPGQDLDVAVNKILYLRQCEDSCVKKNVSWHFVYDKAHGPKPSNIVPPMLTKNTSFNCSAPWPQMTSNFRGVHKLPYPINVLRNVARLQAHTRYVLPSDIELYPSGNVASMFIRYIEREKQAAKGGSGPRVYVIPIFEVQAGLEAPLTKEKLVDLVKKGKAIFFHKWVCDACQKFPGRDDWLKQIPQDGTLGLFKITKRSRNLGSWEPIYIGTNEEPLYDERLTWEGKRDKMSQMFELCLKGYDLYILDNAFLVHAPGIKHVNPQDQKRRMPYIRKNNAVYGEIISTLKKKYSDSKNVC